MFPDASDEHWGRYLTQVPQEELDRGVSVEDMTHEPLGFLSGTFKGSQQRWATVDKEGFAVVIRGAQKATRANLGTLGSGATSFMTNAGHVSLDAEGLFWLPVNGRAVLWIPGGAKQLQVRSMVCAHMKEAGHRGVVATLHRLSEYCCWFNTEEHVAEFVTQCLHCMDSKAGEKVPRSLGETVHGTRPGEVVQFDYLHVGASGPLGDDGLDEDGGYRYILVMMDDMSNWVWLEPTEACTARLTAQHLLTWCNIIGVQEVWVSTLLPSLRIK